MYSIVNSSLGSLEYVFGAVFLSHRHMTILSDSVNPVTIDPGCA